MGASFEQNAVTAVGSVNSYSSANGNVACITSTTPTRTTIDAFGAGSTDITYGEKSEGVTRDYFGQYNSNRSVVVGGKSEFNCSGSQYVIVGDIDGALVDAVGNINSLKAGMVAARSTFNDDRHDNDITSTVTQALSFDINPMDYMNKQTVNDVDYGDPPDTNGKPLLVALTLTADYDLECLVKRAKATALYFPEQIAKSKIDIFSERFKTVMDNIDNIDCNPEVKDKLRAIEEEGDIGALLSLPEAYLNAITCKISHDGKKTDTFDADTYYEQYSKNKDAIIKYETMT